MIKCRNSLTGAIETLRSASPGTLTWYACGPTVYDDAHLGHARNYITQDLIRRIIEQYGGLRVHLQMGITDIDDKIIKKTTETGEPWNQLARRYEMAFIEDLQRLHVLLPTRFTRVSDHIPAIEALVQKLLDSDIAYKTSSGAVYFSINEYRKRGFSYPKLASSKAICGQEGTSSPIEKRDPADFALWKPTKTATEPGWNALGTHGRPGWHIECSSMIHAGMDGAPPDLHTGGTDLRFPHHENEIAQSEAFYQCKPWCPHFLHIGHVTMRGEKMSKSLGNTQSIRQFLDRNSYGADLLRYICAMRHYAETFEFSDGLVDQARSRLNKLRSAINAARLRAEENLNMTCDRPSDADQLIMNSYQQGLSKAKESLLGCDFDTRPMVTLWDDIAEQLHYSQHPIVINEVLRGLFDTTTTLGLNLEKHQDKSYLAELLEFRQRVRHAALQSPQAASILGLCDQLREDLQLKGIEVNDRKPLL